MRPNPYLAYSSFLLLLPVFPYALHNNYVGIIVSVLCSFFSMLYHLTKPEFPKLLLLDQIFGYSTVVYATWMTTRQTILPYLGLIGGAYLLYHVGYQYQYFLWHPNLFIATCWHIVLHLGNGVLISMIAQNLVV